MVVERWRHVTFMHWAVDAALLRPLVPAGLELDLWEGAAWVGLTPFSTTCEVLGRVSLPGRRRFPETNLRTYVRGSDGTDGILFLSLDVTNRANALLGRAMCLPYFRTPNMAVTTTGEGLRYQAERARDGTGYDISIIPGAGITQDDFDVYLTGRWSAYVELRGSIVRFDVEHAPWALQRVDDYTFEETFSARWNLPGVTTPVVHFAAGVDARLSFPRRVMKTGR
jgi:uncharacterized protein YqjF (DUF2071 family)